MRVLRVVLVVFLVLIIMGIIAGAVFIRYSSRKALPDYGENILLQNISDSIYVWRDSTAMPHVYAKNEEDLYRAVGYLMAQDRLWQMDVLRRVTTGRLSEIFGKEMVEVDRLFRSLEFNSKSKIVLDSSSHQIKTALIAYADGVNQYLEDNIGKLPPEFSILGYEPEKWEPLHTINLIGYMSWNLTVPWSTEVRLFRMKQQLNPELYQELIPDTDLHQTYVIPENSQKDIEALTVLEQVNYKLSEMGLQVFQASNSWAVSPSKTKSGQAILANDMHLELNLPGIWYQMHQIVPGKLNVSGLVLPGQPFIICGHNEDVAWGMTNVMLDDMDFYLETIHPVDSTKYKLDGQWRNFRMKKEVIFTREEDTITTYNAFTHRGPIISDFQNIDESKISMRWMGREYSNELQSVYLFNRMSNWDEFRNAAETFRSISQNIIYADKEGNIGMQITGGIPIRNGNGSLIFPGDTSLYDWKGIVEFKELPYVLNPEEGYVVSANNRTIDDDYPYYISRWFDLPSRAEKIIENLDVDEKLGLAEMMELQANQYSAWVESILPYFLQSLRSSGEDFDDKMSTAFSLLETWDYEMSARSIEATIFEQLYFEFLKEIFMDEMGEELFKDFIGQDLLAANFMYNLRRSGQSLWLDNINTTDRKEGSEDIVFSAFKSTLNVLTDKMGRDIDQWQWGKIHTLSFQHPLGTVDALDRAFKLNRGPFQVGGSYHTVSLNSFSLNNLYKVTAGSSHRHLYFPGDWENSKIVIPTGISGLPASPHYMDQTEDYLKFRYNDELFNENSVRKNSMYKMKFAPSEE